MKNISNNILIFSKMFPNSEDSTYGSFVEDQANYLKKTNNIIVIAPIPFFPLPLLKHLSKHKTYYQNNRIKKILIRNGIRVFHPKYIYIPGSANIFLIRFVTMFFILISTIITIIKINKYNSLDLIHIHQVDDEGFIGSIISRLLRIPSILTSHSVKKVKRLWNSNIKKNIYLYTIKQISKIICVSNSVKTRFINFELNPEKLVVINNSVDVSKFYPSSRAKSCHTRLLFVGHLLKSKGIHILLKSLKILIMKRRDNINLTIVGEGRDKNYFEEITKNLGLSRFVNYIGEKEHNEIPSIMSNHDILVHPSFSESFGLVIIEALACGIPVVATRCGGPENIITNETGVLVPINNANALSCAIAKVINNYEMYNPNKLYSYIEKKYSDYVIFQKLDKLYNNVI